MASCSFQGSPTCMDTSSEKCRLRATRFPDADTRGAGRAAADARQAKTVAQESEGVKMDCANNSVLGDNSGGIGLAPDVVECRLNQIMEPSAIERPHKSEGILCRSTKLPLTLLEGII